MSTADAKKQLIATAREMFDLGFNLVPLGAAKAPAVAKGYLNRPLKDVTSEAMDAVRSDRSTGLGVVCNVKSLREHDGGSFILTALELEGKATASEDFLIEWAEAAEHLGASGIIERLESGWKEHTPSGGVRWFFEVPVPNAEYAEWTLKNVVQKSATRNKETFAELLLDKHYIIIAPSFGQTHKDGLPWSIEVGGPTSIPVISVTELHTLSTLLTEVGDVRENPTTANEVVDGRTREVMAAFNRTATNERAIVALTAAGWREVETTPEGEVHLDMASNPTHGMINIGGPAKPPGSLWTFSTSAEPFESDRWYSAFEVLAILSAEGNYTAFAETLVQEGAVRLMPRPLMSRTRPNVFPDDTKTHLLAAQIAGALAEAKHPTDATVPFALLEVDDMQNPIAVLSMTRDGGIHRWNPRNYSSLACAVVQPARIKKNHIAYEHSLSNGVIESVFPGGTPPTTLYSARFIGSNPILLPDGRVVSEPGYHPVERAFVTIPKRDRSFWSSYSVPSKPSAMDAQRALDFVYTELMGDFPWETAGDKARYISYLLTAASRDLYKTAPAFALDAADRGTGKSMAAAIGRFIAFGTVTAQSITCDARHDEELKKEIVSAVLAGYRALHVDDLKRGDKVTSRVLSELITSAGTMHLRVLGSSTSIAIPSMLCTVCGCNIELGADSNRRFIPIRMVHRGASLAFERTGFRHADLNTWVALNRPRLLAALHTILAHGIQNTASEKSLPSDFGSFERWVGVVLGSMTHVKIDGQNAAELVVDGRKEFMDSQDEEGEQWGPVMQAWADTFGSDTWVKAKDAFDRVSKIAPAIELPADLLPQIGQGSAGAARTWGRALLRRRSTAVRINNMVYRFDVKVDSKRGNAFRVVVDSAAPAPGASKHVAVMVEAAAPANTKVKQPVKSKKAKKTRPAVSDSNDLEVA